MKNPLSSIFNKRSSHNEKYSYPWIIVYISFLFISLLLIWVITVKLLPESHFLVGHDSGLALDSQVFLETRLFAWDERINFGSDNSLLFGSLTIHTIDFLTSLLSGSSFAGNRINLFFWLSIMFLSGFTFAYQLREKLGNLIPLIFPYFIVFNFYTFQSIFILERAKYSLIAATLFFLAILVRLLEKKLSLLTSVYLTVITFSIFNGGSWLGLPLYGGMAIIVSVLLVSLFISEIKTRKFNQTKLVAKLIFLSSVLFLLINSYSFLPYIKTFLKTDYQVFQNTITFDANRSWLDYISQGSSFINIFRMQGIPDWYSSRYTTSLMHPFASFYLGNPYLAILSFLIPILALASPLFVKNNIQKKIIALTASTSLISMILMAATRSSWASVYEFLFNNIPGFLIFRSSFYKFGYAFWISFSLLLSFSLSSLILLVSARVNSSNIRKSISLVLVVITVFCWLLYHQKLLSTDIFKWRTDSSTNVKIPDYVNQYKNEVKDEDLTSGRVLLLPKFHYIWQSDGYNWGYWSLSTIHYSLTKQSVLSNNTNLNPAEKEWVNLLYDAINEKDEGKIQSIAKRLGVNRFLLKLDAIPETGWSGGEDPKNLKKILESLDFIKQDKQIGQWIVYKFVDTQFDLFSAKNNLAAIGNTDITTAYKFIQNESVVSNDIKNIDSISGFVSKTITNIECKSCVSEKPIKENELVWTRILPNSFLYRPKIFMENYKLNKIKDPSIKLASYYELVRKRSAEIASMLSIENSEAYIISDLILLRNHLDNILEILEKSNMSNNFSSARTLQENVNAIEELLVNKLSSGESYKLSGALKDEMSKTIYKIGQLKKFYSPVLSDPDKWSTEKVYKFSVDSLPYKIYLDKNSLPVSESNDIRYPEVLVNNKLVTFSNNSTENISNWINLPTDNINIGENTINLKFNLIDSILKIDSVDSLQTPQGSRKCYKSNTLKSSDVEDTYLLKVKTTEDVLKFFPKYKNKSDEISFLDWNNAITINNFYKDDYFRFYYPIPSKNEEFNFYICAEHNYLPSFKEFIVQKIYKPKILGVIERPKPAENIPKITYKRTDPTKYQIHIDNFNKPFILEMNQRYSPQWEIKNKNGDALNISKFPIDLYATGWLISEMPDSDLVIEYSPQHYFYVGEVISAITLVSLSGMLIIIKRRQSRKS